MKLDGTILKTLPKVLLHEHLDGVLRPQTIVDLAQAVGYSELPTTDSSALAHWFHQGAKQGSLAKYLEGFRHTIAVMQTEEALERVAYEQAEDLSKDGIVYFETRFAPLFHTRKGLTHQQVVTAVLKGLGRGQRDFGVHSGLIICARRNMSVSLEMAELAVDFRGRGVLGFDLAGEEGGYPPKKHVDAFHHIQRENFNITIHDGEGFGNLFGRRSNTAGHTASVTGHGSLTTSPSRMEGPSNWVISLNMCSTNEFLSRPVSSAMFTPVPPPVWSSIPSRFCIRKNSG